MKIILCGMGNRSRGDDGFGPYVVENIHETDSIKKIDCDIYPENYLNKIISFSPDLIVFFDTVKKEGSGSIFLKNEEIVEKSPISVSTHSLPFSSIYQYLKKYSHAKIWFWGVRPNSYEKLTDETVTIARQIINVFNALDRHNSNINIMEIHDNLSVTLQNST